MQDNPYKAELLLESGANYNLEDGWYLCELLIDSDVALSRKEDINTT